MSNQLYIENKYTIFTTVWKNKFLFACQSVVYLRNKRASCSQAGRELLCQKGSKWEKARAKYYTTCDLLDSATQYVSPIPANKAEGSALRAQLSADPLTGSLSSDAQHSCRRQQALAGTEFPDSSLQTTHGCCCSSVLRDRQREKPLQSSPLEIAFRRTPQALPFLLGISSCEALGCICIQLQKRFWQKENVSLSTTQQAPTPRADEQVLTQRASK